MTSALPMRSLFMEVLHRLCFFQRLPLHDLLVAVRMCVFLCLRSAVLSRTFRLFCCCIPDMTEVSPPLLTVFSGDVIGVPVWSVALPMYVCAVCCCSLVWCVSSWFALVLRFVCDMIRKTFLMSILVARIINRTAAVP